MKNEPVKLNVARDFGGVINTTFTFVGQNFKKLLSVIAIYAGIPIVISAIIGALYMSKIFSTMGKTDPGFPSDIIPLMLGIFIFGWLTQTLLTLSVNGYIKLYHEKGYAGFEYSEVWAVIKKNFFRIFFSYIPILLLVFVAMMLFIIPGIYLAIVISLVWPVMIIGNERFGGGLSRSFQLIRGRWWVTFGLLFIMSIIVGMIFYLFFIPTYIIIFMQALNGLEMTGTIRIIQSVFLVLGYLVAYFASSVLFISIAIHYFSLVEQKDQPTLLKKIEEIESGTETDSNSIQ